MVESRSREEATSISSTRQEWGPAWGRGLRCVWGVAASISSNLDRGLGRALGRLLGGEGSPNYPTLIN